MSSEPQEIIFIRRSLRTKSDHHTGGVWKIAFADFMTAMMAFFLVMWLISATDQKTRETVASYFNPVKLAGATVDKKGLRDPQEVEKNQTPEATERPSSPSNNDRTYNSDSRAGDHRQAAYERKPRFSEAALFEDPYAVLAALVAGSEPGQAADKVGAFETRGQSGEPGLNGGEAQRDPFDPVYWKMARGPLSLDGKETGGAKVAGDGTAAKAAPPPPATPPVESKAGQTVARQDQPANPPAEADKQAAADATAEVRANAAAASSARKDPAEPTAQRETPPGTADATASEPRPDARPAGQNPGQGVAQAQPSPQVPAQAETRELGRQIQAAIAPISPAPGVQVAQTGEGVLVTLMDDANFGMFAIGSAEPQPELVRAIDAIGKVIGGQKGSIVLRGHTDGRPFRSRDYDNWRLSTARAHMAYYMLVRGGVAAERFERIEGYADHQLKRSDDPGAPQNRRIEILLRRPAA